MRIVLTWIEKTLKYDPSAAYQWRNYDEVMNAGCYSGCADHSIVCGVLLRAAGIPTVWVKTMDVPWIWDFKQGRPFDSWSGHVFLEVYLDKHWVLLDPGAKLIYANYSPRMRILPGNRFAYHKGDDPHEMIVSTQWEAWKQQTRDYCEQLDVALLPVDLAAADSLVPIVDVIGNDPYYKVLADMARGKGWSVRQSYNADDENLLPKSKGRTLLIETHDDAPIVPLDALENVYPNAAAGLQAADGVIVIEGTTILFIGLAKSLNALDITD